LIPPRIRVVKNEGTHDFAEQNDVLTADEEETDPLFGEHVLVVNPLDRIFQDQIG
jgi:hypothetical protein